MRRTFLRSRARGRASTALLRALALTGLVACVADAGPKPERVEKDRVLAGRVATAGDPTRTTPAPGEAARYQLLLASPGPQPQWSYMLGVCHFLRAPDGAPYCDPSLPLIAQSGSEPSSAAPAGEPANLDFMVPAVESLRDDEHELLVQGLVCPGGAFDEALLAALAEQDYSALAAGRNPCADKSKNGLVLSAVFPIERSIEARNHTPIIEALSWSEVMERENLVAGELWSVSASAADSHEGCMGKGFPELHAKERYGFQLQLDAQAREEYLEPSPIPGEAPSSRVEIPQVQGFSSAGHFDILRDNQETAGQLLQLEWSAPSEISNPAGLLVRFWFLATDDRAFDTQATSWEERALCVMP